MKGGKSILGTGNSICGDLATDALHRGEMGPDLKSLSHTHTKLCPSPEGQEVLIELCQGGRGRQRSAHLLGLAVTDTEQS